MNTPSAPLTLDEFDELVEAGQLNTVVCATPDQYGRLVGKRLTIPAFRSLGLSGSGINASSFIFVFMGCVVCGDKATLGPTHGDRTNL